MKNRDDKPRHRPACAAEILGLFAAQIKKAEKRRRNYALGRLRLLAEMGGCCGTCGTIKNLEFHHPFGRDWEPSRTARWVRLARYRREWNAGRLSLLCRSCNGRAH
jgi:hypothetical protein